MDTKHIKIADYNYSLPDERIAKFPLSRRDQSKLLVYRHGQVSDDVFAHLPDYLPEGALMVFNNTKVIQARIHFRKQTGALIEVFLLEPFSPADYEQMFQTTASCSWLCMVGNLKKWKEGALQRVIEIKGQQVEITATRLREHGTSHLVEFRWQAASGATKGQQVKITATHTKRPNDQTAKHPGFSFAEILDAVGELPIPPYLNRKTQESDLTTYQTVYSKIKGSVAAPTAGLHFTPEVLAVLDAHGIDREELTLHVGAGTFRPVKSAEIEGHQMHTEYISVRRQTIEKLIRHEGRAIAVGTTSVRTLESLYYMGVYLSQHPDANEQDLHVCQWTPYEQHPTLTPVEALTEILHWLDRNNISTLHSSTQIIIAPGYEYKIVRMLVTNFHQPQSTLLLLVSAFVKGDWRRIYDYALAHDFRFLSYGDSSLLIP
ncbi:MAG: S-adenosylmethionine:tRNA ribosyltransferase-isomerase [Prevotella sp.]|nr:S-adenosylmethionine:tRNA ribosyltransferase-isomerase [Prevotella sp.]